MLLSDSPISAVVILSDEGLFDSLDGKVAAEYTTDGSAIWNVS